MDPRRDAPPAPTDRGREPARRPPAPAPSPDGGIARLRARLAASPAHRRWVLWTCLAGCFATTFTVTILGVSLRTIAEDLGSDVATIAWVMTAPMLAQAVSAPLLGKLGDLHGHRRVFLIGFAIATVAAFATARAWDAGSLIGLRSFGQLAGTATMPASMAILFQVYEGRERVKAMGWMSVVIAGGPVMGLAVGGVVIEWIGWRPIFVIQGGLSALACAIATLILVETPRRRAVSLDVKGALVFALAALALVFAINRLPGWGVGDPRVWGSLLATPLLLALFARIESRAAHPLLPLELLARRNFVLPLAVGFTLQFAYMGGFIISPLIMMGFFGLGEALTSMWTIARPISLSAASPVGGQLGARYGERSMIVAGSALVFLAMLSFAVGAAWTAMAPIVAGLVLAGLGMGLAQPSLTTMVASDVAREDHGIAVSSMSTATGIGAVAGISILTALCADAGTTTSFRDGYGLGAAVAFLGILASLWLQPIDHDAAAGRPPRPADGETAAAATGASEAAGRASGRPGTDNPQPA